MIIETISTGKLSSNCYIVGSDGEAIIIDTGVNHKDVCLALQKNNLTAKYIVLTHGHFDHAYYLHEIYLVTKAKVAMNKEDEILLLDAEPESLSAVWKRTDYDRNIKFLNDGDVLKIGSIELQVLHTPGHSAGSICLKVDDTIFTGDTLFKEGIGRTDLKNSNFESIKRSIADLMRLNDNIKVYPGHGKSTTIGEERTRAYMRYLNV